MVFLKISISQNYLKEKKAILHKQTVISIYFHYTLQCDFHNNVLVSQQYYSKQFPSIYFCYKANYEKNRITKKNWITNRFH